jgi:ABC-type lipoprotein release transport system permease subunit
LESFALTSSGKHTKGSFIFSVKPEIEDSINHLSGKIISGEYLSSNDNQIMVSSKLAEYLQVQVGDTLVLLGQGYHGITAAAQYRIKGIFYFPIPDLNNKLVYMTLKTGQDFYGAYGRVTSYSLMVNNPNNIEEIKTSLIEKLGDDYEVMTWKEMNRALVQAIESDNAGGIIMLGILYMVIGFGMFGTVMMMTMERRKEFAIMIAVGMQRIKLFFIIFIETLMIGTVAILISILTALPFLSYLHNNPIPLEGDLAEAYMAFGVDPIVPFSIDPSIFVNQTITIIIIALVVILYPLSKVLKLDILKSMRS